MSDSSGPASVSRRAARSGALSYSPPVVLHETSKRQVVVVPFFIPRSSGNELAIKIQSYRKGEAPTPWVLIEERSVSLTEAATRLLLQAIKTHLHVAQSETDGDYILIKVADGVAELGQHDPGAVANAIMQVLSRKDIASHLANTELSSQFLDALRGSIRLTEMTNAVASLREMLESGESDEQWYQEWCEDHFWVFGNAYILRDEFRRFSEADQADLLMACTASGFRDILELKRPDMEVLRYDGSHQSYFFASDVTRAIGQVHRYMDVLAEVASRGLRDRPEVVAYHPRSIIVIGRSHRWDGDKHRALHGLNRRLHDITIMTYDNLLLQAERLLEIVKPRRDDDDSKGSFDPLDDLDEEIPF